MTYLVAVNKLRVFFPLSSKSQNPTNCSTARRLYCNLKKPCGYGCQIHHLLYCFILAYGTERTLVLESYGWKYSQGGWEKVFKPLSDTCEYKSGEKTVPWSGMCL